MTLYQAPPGPPFDLPMHPDFRRRITEFGDWLNRFNHEDNKTVARHLRFRLLVYVVLIGATFCGIVLLDLNTSTAITAMIATCTLSLIATINEHQRSEMWGNGNTDLNIRFLAKLIHELEYEKRQQSDGGR